MKVRGEYGGDGLAILKDQLGFSRSHRRCPTKHRGDQSTCHGFQDRGVCAISSVWCHTGLPDWRRTSPLSLICLRCLLASRTLFVWLRLLLPDLGTHWLAAPCHHGLLDIGIPHHPEPLLWPALTAFTSWLNFSCDSPDFNIQWLFLCSRFFPCIVVRSQSHSCKNKRAFPYLFTVNRSELILLFHSDNPSNRTS